MIERREERHAGRFTERLSWFMAWVAAFGGIYVILDPVITINVGELGTVKLGGEGFAEQLKGAVVALILIEGWKAVKEYWLGGSAGGQKAAESVAKIAEGAAPTQAAAVAAARSDPVQPAAPAATKEDPLPVQIVQGPEEVPINVKDDGK